MVSLIPVMVQVIRWGGVGIAAAWLAGFNPAVPAGEWPGFLGPNRDGFQPGETLPDQWPGGPRKLWQRDVGSGFSGPIALTERVVLHHRLGNEEHLWSLDPVTGEEQWRFFYPTNYRDDFGFDNGPRSTPTAYRGRLYAYGAQGVLNCLDLQTGRGIWRVDTRLLLNAPKGFFGLACSPLASGDELLLNVGGSGGNGIVAFDRLTGDIRWKASRDEASYSSPVAATIGGVRQAIFFDRQGLKAVELGTGRIRSTWRWRPRVGASVNAASPVVYGNQVMLTTSYDTGAIVLDLTRPMPQKVWSNDLSLSSHYSTPVRQGDYLYGFHGRQERGAILRCVSWRDGEIKWSQPNVRNGSILSVGERLLILQENGELIMAVATPERYQELDRAQILPFGVRAYPAFADGVLYARSPKVLVAFRLR